MNLSWKIEDFTLTCIRVSLKFNKNFDIVRFSRKEKPHFIFVKIIRAIELKILDVRIIRRN